MRKLTLGLAFLVAGATSASCSKNMSAADCEKFADHMLDLTVKQMAGMLPPPRPGMPSPLESAKQAVQSQRATFVTQCATLPRAAYDCMMKASSVSEMTPCATAK
jgi:hypothetical protein